MSMRSANRFLHPSRVSLLLVLGASVVAPTRPAIAASQRAPGLDVFPRLVQLDGGGEGQQLVVTRLGSELSTADVTRSAQYRSSKPEVASVDAEGHVEWRGSGTARIDISSGAGRAQVTVVCKATRSPAGTFRRDILPLLSRTGCSQGACHAKQGGQRGFQLSVLNFDPESDYIAVTRRGGGRRIDRVDPGRSLLLLKATGTLPHAGGKRFDVKSPEYATLARWIASGAPWGPTDEPVLTRVELTPAIRTLTPGSSQQLAATAVYSDKTRRDVTHLVEFRSNESGIAEVKEGGRMVSSGAAGDTAVLARFLSEVAVTRVTVPQTAEIPAAAYRAFPRYNFIDDSIYRKLSRLNLLPSQQCDDATYLRRVSVDLIGTLPTPAEVQTYLTACAQETRDLPAGSSALKSRAEWTKQLLDRPEYADYWATRWVNLLLVDRDPLFPKGAFAYDRWVRQAFQSNMPFNQFASDIVTATGETYRDGPANLFRALATPIEQGKSLSQLFLGVRIDCAQCHHHPNERWSQDDFYSMAAFFARVRRKGATEFEQVVYNGPDGEVKHPKTDAVLPLRPLGGSVLTPGPDEDRREALARWMTADDNPYFARAIVNRVWGMLMGVGIVEPIDDFRATNPASNPELLDALAVDFKRSGYDLKHLMRTIAASAAYQRSSQVNRFNSRDARNYARYYPRRFSAEVLLDSVSAVTGVPETFQGHPATTRAIQMWDNKLPVEFLEVFGKPSRLSVCECDRPTDGSVTQVLHLMNSSAIQNRLTSDAGTVAELAKAEKKPDELVEQLYLLAYGRAPRDDERAAGLRAFERSGVKRREAVEDLLWALMNSAEFLFNH